MGEAVNEKVAPCFRGSLSVDNASKAQNHLGHQALGDHHINPEGHDLPCRQITVPRNLEVRQPPFFMKWKSLDHPSIECKAIESTEEIITEDILKLVESWF
jgi:hypothetical protein